MLQVAPLMRPRPRIQSTVSLPPSEVLERFEAALAEPGAVCSGGTGRRDVTLRLHPRLRQRWSPWLQLRVEACAEGSELQGTMGPAAELWTAFVFCYAVLVTVFVAGTMYGFVQFTMNDSPTGLWFAAGALVGLGAACGLDLLGRRMGEGQMGLIRGFVERAVGVSPAEVISDSSRTSPSDSAMHTG